MKYLFPFKKVKAQSNIILYGAGNVGKEFCLQLRHSKYCKIVAWVDRSFDGMNLNPPFDYVDNIQKHKFDYVVIAIIDRSTAKYVKELLTKKGIPQEKIIWSHALYLEGAEMFPIVKKKFLLDFEEYMEIIDKYLDIDTNFSSHMFYESYAEMGIKGVRDSQERLALYKVRDYLNNEDTVLDIGCNCGFMALQTAPFVKSVTGLEIEESFIEIADKVKKMAGIENAFFLCADFLKYNSSEKFSAIFSFAVHSALIDYISINEYADRLYNLLKQSGYIFLESHRFDDDKNDFEHLVGCLINKGMSICHELDYSFIAERRVVVLKDKG